MPTRIIAPLLVEPAPPFLESQAAVAQGAGDIAELAQWRYRLRYRAEHAAQDEVIVTVSFNVPPSEDAHAADDAPPRADVRYRVQLEFSDDGEAFRALRLVREPNESGLAGHWPDVDYRASSDAVVDLGSGEGDDTTRTYAFDPVLPSEYWPGIGLTWNRLDAAGLQNARASLAVVRNRNLGELVAEEHVYRSAIVDAAQPVSPLNRWTQDIAIDDLGDSLEAALDALLARLFGERRIGQRVTMQLQYGMRVTAGDDGTALMNYVPVALFPPAAITATTVSELAAAAAAWNDAMRPPTLGSEWLIALAQFSRLDPNAPQALLEIARLVYRV